MNCEVRQFVIVIGFSTSHPPPKKIMVQVNSVTKMEKHTVNIKTVMQGKSLEILKTMILVWKTTGYVIQSSFRKYELKDYTIYAATHLAVFHAS